MQIVSHLIVQASKSQSVDVELLGFLPYCSTAVQNTKIS